MDSTLWNLLALASGAVGLSTLFGFMARVDWRLELFSHFRVQYFLLLAGSSLVFLLERSYLAALLSSLFAMANLGVILPIYRKPQQVAYNGHHKYRLLLANVLQPNRAYQKALRLIEQVDPDFIVLAEVNQDWLEALGPVREAYPHGELGLREDNYGVALFSRIPFEDVAIHIFGEGGLPSIVARLRLEGERFTIVATHPHAPENGEKAGQRNRQLAEVAEFVASLDGCVIVAGDLNITSWSPHFQDVMSRSGLRDSRQGFGVQPSWPVNYPLFLIPLDHVLASPGILIRSRWIGPPFGSDHLPVSIEFSFNSRSHGSAGKTRSSFPSSRS